jgi:hypothetical protein
MRITGASDGEFESKEYAWGNKERSGMVLKYTVTSGLYGERCDRRACDRGLTMDIFSSVEK